MNFQIKMSGVDCLVEDDGRTLYLARIRVAHKGQGIGSAIMHLLKAHSRSVGKPILLRFDPDEGFAEAARKFYRKHGFTMMRDNEMMIWHP